MSENDFSTRAASAIIIYCPCDPVTFGYFNAGDVGVIDRDPVVAAMLTIIRDHGMGDFGSYHAVVEISAGIERFLPTAEARPTLGQVGERTMSPTITLTTYVAADWPADRLDAALGALIDAHPWEVPVIEVRPTRLMTRD